MKIRAVDTADAAMIAEIYNFYVENSHATFEIETVSEAEMRRRIETIAQNYPFWVGEIENELVGYAYAAKYKERAAYRHSVEISVYIKTDAVGKGIGARLYEKLFESLKPLPIHAIIAGISLPNEASVRLHEKFGMEKVAHFREVGFKFNRWIDVGYWEKINQKV